MNNETDLDWLARNVHVWREGANYICVNHTDGGHVFHEHNRNCAVWFTRDQWLARRAELQNKPRFSDHPDAKCFVQNDTGTWFKNSKSINVRHESTGRWFDYDMSNGWVLLGAGEVLGDWRDTLEQRPDMHKTTPEIDTSAERVQETSKSMRDWHERGELPPVGTECVIWSEGRFPPAECKIAAYSMERVCVRWNGSGDLDVIDLQFKNQSECNFRPIRTERDELIEVLKGTHAASLTNLDMLASAILAAGFSRRDK